MADCDAALVYVGEQTPIRPQFVGIAQFFRILARTVLHPCNRIVRQLSRLAGSGQFSKRCFQAELQKLLNTRDNRAATDMMMPGNGLITLAGARIQEKRRPKRTPFFFGSRFANGLEIEQILLAELEGTALPREGHDPLKHKSSQMYRYLENANLVSLALPGIMAAHTAMPLARAAAISALGI